MSLPWLEVFDLKQNQSVCIWYTCITTTLVAKSIGKKILNSETAKNVGNTLLTAGTETAANVIGDLVEETF